MKLLILGTSNSLLKDGWVAGLRAALPDATIENCSIGGSPGIQFAAHAGRDFTAYDFVFVDSIPNDEQYAYETPGYADGPLSQRILFEILSTIACQTNLIILGFCLKDFLHNKSAIFKQRQRMAMAVGAAFVDVAKLVIAIGKALKQHELYEAHPAHPLSRISKTIGNLLGQELANGNYKSPDKKPQDYRRHFSVLKPEDYAPADAIIERSNSLMRQTFAVVNPDKPLEFSNQGRSIGFFVNGFATVCNAILADGAVPKLNLKLHYLYYDSKLLKLFMPLPQRIAFNRINVSREDFQPSFKPRMTESYFARKSGPILQIAEILFWSGDEHVPWDTECLCTEAEILTLSEAVLARFHANQLKASIFAEKWGANEVLYLKTIHNSFVVYDRNVNRCVHKYEKEIGAYIAPVLLVRNNSVTFNVFPVKNMGFNLAVSRIGIFANMAAVAPEDGQPDMMLGEQIHLEPKENGSFLLRCEGYYLSAEPDGRLVCNRTTPRNWERFSFAYFPDEVSLA